MNRLLPSLSATTSTHAAGLREALPAQGEERVLDVTGLRVGLCRLGKRALGYSSFVAPLGVRSSHPRARAVSARAGEGLTAMAWPTTASIGVSESSSPYA